VPGLRTPLPGTLVPGERMTALLRVRAPAQAGSYVLRATLVQEGVAWFDELDPGNACDLIVGVTEP